MSITQTILENSPAKLYTAVRETLKEKAVGAIEDSKAGLCEAGFKRVNRVRKGKIQRRHKVSRKQGYTIRGGKSTRMSPGERRRRSRSQRKGARRRKAKKSQSLRKRRISMRKSKRLS